MTTTPGPAPEPLSGIRLWLAGLALSIANFIVVLDISITAVSVPHIAGGLAVSPSQGTWTITSYAVAEAISVPLTGWLAMRFGTVRWFIISMTGFSLFSLVCGLAPTLGILVTARIFQGLFGGPLMPLSQSLLMRIFPKEKQAVALALWAITTVTAPILGPIVGGRIADNWSWPWIFYINLPVCLGAIYVMMRYVTPFETIREKVRVDIVGLVLLVGWVGCFQMMLDLGQEHGWFDSAMIAALGVAAFILFIVFVIWEWTEPNPMVDVRMIKNKGFALATLALSLAFGAFFALVVILPIWVQQVRGYTASESGNIMAWMGVLAVVLAPVSARLMGKVDLRITVSLATVWLGSMSLLRTTWNTESTYFMLVLPQLLQGMAMPFFFMGATALALGQVKPDQITSAAGLMSFVRTLAGAGAAAMTTATWTQYTHQSRSEISGTLNGGEAVMGQMQGAGLGQEQSRGVIEMLVDAQAATQAASQIYMVLFCFFLLAAASVWLVPKLKGPVAMNAGH